MIVFAGKPIHCSLSPIVKSKRRASSRIIKTDNLNIIANEVSIKNNSSKTKLCKNNIKTNSVNCFSKRHTTINNVDKKIIEKPYDTTKKLMKVIYMKKNYNNCSLSRSFIKNNKFRILNKKECSQKTERMIKYPDARIDEKFISECVDSMKLNRGFCVGSSIKPRNYKSIICKIKNKIIELYNKNKTNNQNEKNHFIKKIIKFCIKSILRNIKKTNSSHGNINAKTFTTPLRGYKINSLKSFSAQFLFNLFLLPTTTIKPLRHTKPPFTLLQKYFHQNVPRRRLGNEKKYPLKLTNIGITSANVHLKNNMEHSKSVTNAFLKHHKRSIKVFDDDDDYDFALNNSAFYNIGDFKTTENDYLSYFIEKNKNNNFDKNDGGQKVMKNNKEINGDHKESDYRAVKNNNLNNLQIHKNSYSKINNDLDLEYESNTKNENYFEEKGIGISPTHFAKTSYKDKKEKRKEKTRFLFENVSDENYKKTNNVRNKARKSYLQNKGESNYANKKNAKSIFNGKNDEFTKIGISTNNENNNAEIKNGRKVDEKNNDIDSRIITSIKDKSFYDKDFYKLITKTRKSESVKRKRYWLPETNWVAETDGNLATDIYLRHPFHITFSPDGNLFVLESFKPNTNMVGQLFRLEVFILVFYIKL